jgi:hypothetical protein
MPVPLAQVRRLAFNDEEIGMGFNSESGLAVGTALEGFTVQEDEVAPGLETDSTITVVTSYEELMKKLDMSFEAQGRYGPLSASAKVEFSESSNYNSTSTFLVARVIVQNPLRRGTGFRVTQQAQELLRIPGLDEFRKAYGDSFVRGLQTGGEFYAVIRITSVSSSTQMDLAVTLQAEFNGGLSAGSFKGRLETANASASTRSEYTATMFQRGGSGEQASPIVEIREVLARYKAFPAIASSNAFPYQTEVATYDTLPLPVPTPEEQENFLIALRDAWEKKLRYIQTRNDLEFARRNPAILETAASSEALASAISVYVQLINAVMDHTIRLSRGQMSPPRLFDPSALSPPLAEPAPIPVRRAAPLDAPLPDMVGVDRVWIDVVWRCLADDPDEENRVQRCLDRVFPGNLPNPLSREIVEFLALTAPVPRVDPSLPAKAPKVRLIILQDSTVGLMNQLGFGFNFVRAQLPPGGAPVAEASDVLLFSHQVL